MHVVRNIYNMLTQHVGKPVKCDPTFCENRKGLFVFESSYVVEFSEETFYCWLVQK